MRGLADRGYGERSVPEVKGKWQIYRFLEIQRRKRKRSFKGMPMQGAEDAVHGRFFAGMQAFTSRG